MNKFTKITSIVIPLEIEDVDTDQIIPARFLKAVNREEFGAKLFYNWRYDEMGKPKKDFLFNQPFYKKAQILLVGKNFGIGSSREHAVWALVDWGIRVIIGSSFGDIFYQNSLKNGLLIIKLRPDEVEQIFNLIKSFPKQKITIDLINQQVIYKKGEFFNFEIDPYRKKCLTEGIDDLGYLLAKETEIKRFEEKHCIW